MPSGNLRINLQWSIICAVSPSPLFAYTQFQAEYKIGILANTTNSYTRRIKVYDFSQIFQFQLAQIIIIIIIIIMSKVQQQPLIPNFLGSAMDHQKIS